MRRSQQKYEYHKEFTKSLSFTKSYLYVFGMEAEPRVDVDLEGKVWEEKVAHSSRVLLASKLIVPVPELGFSHLYTSDPEPEHVLQQFWRLALPREVRPLQHRARGSVQRRYGCRMYTIPPTDNTEDQPGWSFLIPIFSRFTESDDGLRPAADILLSNKFRKSFSQLPNSSKPHQASPPFSILAIRGQFLWGNELLRSVFSPCQSTPRS